MLVPICAHPHPFRSARPSFSHAHPCCFLFTNTVARALIVILSSPRPPLVAGISSPHASAAAPLLELSARQLLAAPAGAYAFARELLGAPALISRLYETSPQQIVRIMRETLSPCVPRILSALESISGSFEELARGLGYGAGGSAAQPSPPMVCICGNLVELMRNAGACAHGSVGASADGGGVASADGGGVASERPSETPPLQLRAYASVLCAALPCMSLALGTPPPAATSGVSALSDESSSDEEMEVVEDRMGMHSGMHSTEPLGEAANRGETLRDGRGGSVRSGGGSVEEEAPWEWREEYDEWREAVRAQYAALCTAEHAGLLIHAALNLNEAGGGWGGGWGGLGGDSTDDGHVAITGASPHRQVDVAYVTGGGGGGGGGGGSARCSSSSNHSAALSADSRRTLGHLARVLCELIYGI